MKKIVACLLVAVSILMHVSPVFAEECSKAYVYKTSTGERISADTTIKLEFLKDFDINESHEGQEVPFRSVERIVDVDNTVLPAGTKFVGKVISKENSKFGFRRASANIQIQKMILPNGKEYIIKSAPVSGDLKSSAALNAAKGVGMAAASTGVCVFGAAAIAIECLSVGGLILAPITGTAVGAALAVTSKGLNYKANAGTQIMFIFKEPVDIDLQDINR